MTQLFLRGSRPTNLCVPLWDEARAGARTCAAIAFSAGAAEQFSVDPAADGWSIILYRGRSWLTTTDYGVGRDYQRVTKEYANDVIIVYVILKRYNCNCKLSKSYFSPRSQWQVHWRKSVKNENYWRDAADFSNGTYLASGQLEN